MITALVAVFLGVLLVLLRDTKATALAVGELGPDPFLTEDITNRESHAPDVPDAPVPPDAGTDDIPPTNTLEGDTPGVYGGSLRAKICDRDRLIQFLEDEKNSEKAKVWAEVLDISPSGIRDHVTKLTPVILRTDTLVKNHGFKDGKSTEFLSLLQAGIAVLIDQHGTPTVKCYCGNPLTLSDADPKDVKYDFWNKKWNVSKEKVKVIKPGKEKKEHFDLRDTEDGKNIYRPAGTEGTGDQKKPPSGSTDSDNYPPDGSMESSPPGYHNQPPGDHKNPPPGNYKSPPSDTSESPPGYNNQPPGNGKLPPDNNQPPPGNGKPSGNGKLPPDNNQPPDNGKESHIPRV